MSETLQYRTSKPADFGLETEDEEREALWINIQETLHSSGPSEFLDSMLVITNICEHRAMLQPDTALGEWYSQLGMMLRLVLTEASTSEHAPNSKLEDGTLYFVEPEITH